MQYLNPFLVLLIVVGSIKIIIETPWAGFTIMHIPKKIANLYLILTILFIQVVYLYLFLPNKINFMLIFSAILGFPSGAISLFFYLPHLKDVDKKIKKKDFWAILISFPVVTLTIAIIYNYLKKLNISI